MIEGNNLKQLLLNTKYANKMKNKLETMICFQALEVTYIYVDLGTNTTIFNRLHILHNLLLY